MRPSTDRAFFEAYPRYVDEIRQSIDGPTLAGGRRARSRGGLLCSCICSCMRASDAA